MFIEFYEQLVEAEAELIAKAKHLDTKQDHDTMVNAIRDSFYTLKNHLKSAEGKVQYGNVGQEDWELESRKQLNRF